jgi:hypothetical protein
MHSRRWLIAAVVACVLMSACSDFNTNLSVQTSSSSVSFVSPATATAGQSADFPITVNGAGFVSSGTFILWNAGTANQVQLANTAFQSSTQLTATVPAALLAVPGTVPVAVQIPGSAQSGSSSTTATTTTEVSNIVLFTINPAAGPAATISTLSATPNSKASTPYCSPNSLTLTVNGTNFVNGAVVNWNGSPRATTFVSSTQLTATILPTDTAKSGTAAVSVSTPTGTSNSISFTMTTPATNLPTPSIASISQSLFAMNPPVGTATSVPAGSPTFTLTVNGSSLLPCSTVQFGSDPQATTYVSPTQLTATIPASEVFSAGVGGTARTVSVTVSTITPGGGTSGPSLFTITP